MLVFESPLVFGSATVKLNHPNNSKLRIRRRLPLGVYGMRRVKVKSTSIGFFTMPSAVMLIGIFADSVAMKTTATDRIG